MGCLHHLTEYIFCCSFGNYKVFDGGAETDLFIRVVF